MANSNENNASAASAKGIEGMLTLVCITCGNEMFFTTKPPADNETCSKCGGNVFRSFFTPIVRDEATETMLEDTARSSSLEGAPTDSTAGDRRDLNSP